MQAYYEGLGGHEAWESAWQVADTRRLMEAFRGSWLYDLIRDALPHPIKAGLVLDAGCGPGAWTGCLQADGYVIEGVDDSFTAVRRAQEAGLPVQRGELTRLPYATGAVGVYLSLGVVEHDPLGPSAILREAYRVTAPGGTMILSVPYVNGLRWLTAPIIRWWQERQAQAGACFYQYTFTQAEIMSALRGAGFRPVRTIPYGPTKMFRRALTAGLRASVDAATAAKRLPIWKRMLLAILYTRVATRLCGHMLLVVCAR